MRFEFKVEVERVQGKFASKEEIEAQIVEALEGADPGSYDGENGGEYQTADWSVGPFDDPKVVTPGRARRVR